MNETEFTATPAEVAANVQSLLCMPWSNVQVQSNSIPQDCECL